MKIHFCSNIENDAKLNEIERYFAKVRGRSITAIEMVLEAILNAKNRANISNQSEIEERMAGRNSQRERAKRYR